MNQNYRAYILLGCMLFAATACGERVERICVTPAPTGASGSEDAFSEIPPIDYLQAAEDIQATWQTGPHSGWLSDPDPENDPECDRCHTPFAKSVSAQPSKLSRTNAEISIDFSAGCRLCHPQISAESKPEVAWMVDVEQAQYKVVDAVDEPCKHCHVAENVDGHLFVQLDGAHAEFMCTGCHDPHTAAASCSSAGCHQPFRAECQPVQTHDKPHTAATCSACHASGDVEIGWDEERQVWHSFFAKQVAGIIELEGRTSHNLQLEAKCERCHTPGELPWDH
jgi:hypothetical protein